MKIVRLFTVAALALALAACNKDGEKRVPSGIISVDATIGTMTKVAYSGNSSAFETGDNLTLTAWTGSNTAVPEQRVVDRVNHTLTSGEWVPATQIKWADMVTPHYFVAVSPARNIASFTADAYTLDPSADKFQQSDLLIATRLDGLVADDHRVELVFDHAMAKLNVNLTFRDQWTALPKENPEAPDTEALVASVSATGKTTATVNYLSKAVTATGDASAIAMNKLANANWTTLMVPQTGFRTVTIVLSGNDEWLGGNGTFVYNAPADITLESGKITTLNLILGRDQIVLADNGITITDWATDVSLPDGEAVIPEED